MMKYICPRCKSSDSFVSRQLGSYTCTHCAMTINGKSLKLAIESSCHYFKKEPTKAKEPITIDAKFKKSIELKVRETIPEDEMVKRQKITLKPRKKSSFKYEVK